MRHGLLTALALLAACGGARPRATTPLARGGAVAAPAAPTAAAPTGARADAIVTGRPIIPETWSLAGKGVAVSRPRAMVVSGHPLASRVGLEVLKAGGNAVDAAVAVGFALGVVLPEAGNIGGGGFIVFRDTTGRVRALDYREMAPGGATRAMYVDSTGNPTEQSLTGHLASGVPGSVAGMYEAWKSAGRLPWAKVLAPAIRLAREHTLDAARSRSIAEETDRLARFPASAQQFLVDGHAPPPGAKFRQPELARTLQLIADSGPSAFYKGQIADLIAAEMQRGHGLITKEDLKRYQPKWRTPVQISYRGYTIYSMPPASSGGVTMGEILNIMEGYDTLPPFGSAGYVHLEVEAMRRAFMDRNHWLGDPDAVDRAGTRRPAAHGARDAGRADHHQQRVSGHRERGGPRHVARGGGRGAARAPASAAGRGLLRARRARPDDARRPARYGLPATRAGSHGRYRGHRTHRRRLGRCRRSQARRRRGRILKDQAARFTVSGLLSLSVIAAPLGSTTSMSRDARAAAAPAAAPTAPPIKAPFVFLPSSLPTRAPAIAPPPTLAASPLVTPRPCITVSLDSTVASTA